MLNRSPQQTWRIGVLPGQSQTAIAVVRVPREGRPILKQLSLLPTAGDEAGNALISLTRDRALAKAPVSGVVSPEDYRLVQVEAPEVLPAELRAAVRWRLKDVIDFNIDEATCDIFEMPDPPRRTHQRMMYAVAARNEAVQRVAQAISPYARGFDVIDIPELCQRNLAAHLAQDKKGVALLTLAESSAQLVLTREGTLYLTRRIELSRVSPTSASSPPRFGDSAANSLDVSSLALEVQRSLDYYESHYDHMPVSQLVIAPGDERATALAASLRNEMSLQIEVFKPADVVELETDADLMLDWQGLMALGAALRNERVKP